ncbi:MAG: pseudaminic acid synthase [Omnitrophica WOR_2 bacterium RIFCSPLOWO2_02_FULL_50_19]|nr:MAG: pseudaminic acid synthase [Omnitrophica WOR_2 bacterium RIFCSPLOWO2_02_FULL_50_19]
MVNFKKIDSCFIIAEISANHGQDFKRAVALIKEAKRSGADAVKFQTYSPDTLTIDVNNKYFRIKHPKWGGQRLYELYKRAYTPWSWFKKLKSVAGDLDIMFFSTAFDKTSVDFLEELNVPMHKIASFEVTDLPLIEYASKTGKPLIISTGMASFKEIEEAVITAKKAGAEDIALLKCVSDYPARPEEMNLKTIPDMIKKFNCPIGLSDHSLGIAASIAAVSLGAKMLEKHFTLSRKIKTPDSFFSMEPREFKLLIENVRIAEKAMGKVFYGLSREEKKNRVFRRSLFAVRDIKKGELFTEENIRSIRPNYGLPPKSLKDILGKKAKKDIKKGTPMSLGLVDRK